MILVVVTSGHLTEPAPHAPIPQQTQTDSSPLGSRVCDLLVCFLVAGCGGCNEALLPPQGPSMKSNQCCWWKDIKKKKKFDSPRAMGIEPFKQTQIRLQRVQTRKAFRATDVGGKGLGRTELLEARSLATERSESFCTWESDLFKIEIHFPGL